MVAHSGYLYDDLTCRENLAFYGRLYAVEDLPQRVAEALERVGLSHRADRRVRSLSHGMQKRLAIARAILHRPSLLLLDEPESGLDRQSVAALADLLREWTASGRSVVMTTHNVDLGLAWATTAAVMSNGKLNPEGERRITWVWGDRGLTVSLLSGPSAISAQHGTLRGNAPRKATHVSCQLILRISE